MSNLKTWMKSWSNSPVIDIRCRIRQCRKWCVPRPKSQGANSIRNHLSSFVTWSTPYRYPWWALHLQFWVQAASLCAARLSIRATRSFHSSRWAWHRVILGTICSISRMLCLMTRARWRSMLSTTRRYRSSIWRQWGLTRESAPVRMTLHSCTWKPRIASRSQTQTTTCWWLNQMLLMPRSKMWKQYCRGVERVLMKTSPGHQGSRELSLKQLFHSQAKRMITIPGWWPRQMPPRKWPERATQGQKRQQGWAKALAGSTRQVT